MLTDFGAERPHRGQAAVNGDGIGSGVLRGRKRVRKAKADRAHVGGRSHAHRPSACASNQAQVVLPLVSGDARDGERL